MWRLAQRAGTDAVLLKDCSDGLDVIARTLAEAPAPPCHSVTRLHGFWLGSVWMQNPLCLRHGYHHQLSLPLDQPRVCFPFPAHGPGWGPPWNPEPPALAALGLQQPRAALATPHLPIPTKPPSSLPGDPSAPWGAPQPWVSHLECPQTLPRPFPW